MVDTNIFDKLATHGACAEAILAAVHSGAVSVPATDVQPEELEAIPDAARRQRLLSILPVAERAPMPRSGRLGSMMLGTESAILGGALLLGTTYRAFLSAHGGNRPDAIIASRAEEVADVLVSEDRRLRRFAARLLTLEVWS